MIIGILTLMAVLFENYVSIHLSITAITIIGWFYSGKRALLPAILLGLVADIALVRPLGITSVFLVVLVSSLIISRLQFEWESPFFVFVVAVLGELLISIYLRQYVSLLLLISQGILTLGLWIIFTRMRFKEGVYLKK